MAPPPTGRVLVLGDDMRIFLSVCRALGRAGKAVHVVPFDAGSPALKSRYIAAVHRVPGYLEHPAEWLAAIRELISVYGFDLIIPCTDPAIIALDRNRVALGDQRLAIPAAANMEIFFDKETTHSTCRQIGVPVLKALRLDELEGADDIVSQFGIPVVIKPRRSFWEDSLGSRDKVHIIENDGQIRHVLSSLENPSRYLVERYFDGQGIGVSVLADKGTILQAFQHRRLREGKGGCSSYRISEPLDPGMLASCEKICQHTGHTGVCMFEFRRDPQTGQTMLLETNSRFWGSMPLPTSLGVDFPNRLYDLLVLGIAHPGASYPAGVRSRNLILDGYNIYKRAREAKLKTLPSVLAETSGYILQPFRWLAGTERSDSFVFDDLNPALMELLKLPPGLLRKFWPRSANGHRARARDGYAK